MEILYENLLQMDWRYLVMWAIGGILIYLAIKKDMEPTLLLPIGFGTILVNLPGWLFHVFQYFTGRIFRSAISLSSGVLVFMSLSQLQMRWT